MDIKISKSGSVDIVEIDGRVDATNAGQLEATLTQCIDAGALKVLIDLKGLTYISSSGLRVFLMMAKKLEKSGKIAICSMQTQVEQIFTISGFNNIFPIFANRVEGEAHLNQFA